MQQLQTNFLKGNKKHSSTGNIHFANGGFSIAMLVFFLGDGTSPKFAE